MLIKPLTAEFRRYLSKRASVGVQQVAVYSSVVVRKRKFIGKGGKERYSYSGHFYHPKIII